MLKIGDTIVYKAEQYANSETVGTVDGYTVFVPMLIVGEVARVRVNYVKKNVAYATVEQLLTPSQLRVSPVCKSFGKCGGCVLAHIDYDEQLLFKRNKVANSFKKIAKTDANMLPCVASPQIWGYRNKLSLPVRGVRGDVKVGMFERNTHRIVPTQFCALAGDWAAKVISAFTDYCNEMGVPPYDELRFTGVARHLAARYVEGQLLVTVVSNGEFNFDLRPLWDKLAQNFCRVGLFVNVNTARNNVILGKTTKHICGLQYIEGEHFNVKFRLRPNSFFQVNDGVKDLVYAKVKQLADTSQTDVLVDCFSGIGILTQALASKNFDSYAIEIDPSAVQDAEDMARLNRTKRLVNICGDVTVQLPKLVEANQGKRFTVVVDPPRKGLNETIVDALKRAQAESIIYVSCDPATLARDCAMVSDKYYIAYAQPFDMFPQTDQVETVVLLGKRN